MSDEELYEQAMKRMRKAGMTDAGLSRRIENVVFLEKEIENYRRKLRYAEDRIKALCAEQMQAIQYEQKKLHETTTLEAVQESSLGEIIKALSDNGFNNISINIYKTKEENSDD